jgi:hypothetical protein
MPFLFEEFSFGSWKVRFSDNLQKPTVAGGNQNSFFALNFPKGIATRKERVFDFDLRLSSLQGQ